MRIPEHTDAVVLSNLAKASEKQLRGVESEQLNTLAQELYETGSGSQSFADVKELITDDIGNGYPAVESIAKQQGDRGALRAVTWGKKVTAIQKSLVDRYIMQGEKLLDGKGVYLCEACGFVFLGSDAPDICPICKAPKHRFSGIS